MARTTIKDVAKAAGVSTSTVSHVINGTRFVDPNTKARVSQALQHLGYEPNLLARSLRNGITKTIGLVVPDASNPFFAEIARKIEDVGFLQGYSVILCNSDNQPIKQSSYVNMLLAKQVDGVIFISTDNLPNDLNRLVHNNIPLVVADRDISLSIADVVQLDNYKAGYDATKHLIDLGHKRIACITGPSNIAPSKQRVDGYKDCLKDHEIGFRNEMVKTGSFTIDSGKIAMKILLQQDHKPTAVFVLNDMMAFGAMSVITSSGLRIPEDISVIGFDDIELCSVIVPGLTTMAQPIQQIAESATHLLIDRLNGLRDSKNRLVIHTAQLVERQSTAHI